MSRSALIGSCVLHGGVLALVGWSFSIAPRPMSGPRELNILVSPGDSTAAPEASPAPTLDPKLAEALFTPRAPEIAPPPAPVSTIDSTLPTIPTVNPIPPRVSGSAPLKGAHAARPTRTSRGDKGTASSGIGQANADVGGGGGGDYQPPQFLLRYKPPYPAEARAQRLEGLVLLLVSIDAGGRVTNAAIHQGCGHSVLDHAALEAVRSWRFTPARQAGRNVPASVEVPVRFNFSA